MKAARLFEPNDFNTVDIEKPQITENEILIKVNYCAFCGTDIRILEGKKTKDVRYPSTIGHEFSGVVCEVGSSISGYKVGDRVCVAPVIYCNSCYYCLSDRENACLNRTALGYQFDGGFAEYVKIPETSIKNGNVVKLPDNVSFEEGALVEPLACCLNGVGKADVKLNDTVLIVGAGPIGLMHLQLVKAAGAKKVIVSEIIESRREKAENMGADIVINPIEDNLKDIILNNTEGLGIDKVIMAIGAVSIVNEILMMVKKGGTVNLFAGYAGKGESTLELNTIHYNEINVNGTTSLKRMDYLNALSLIESGKINVKDLISHTFSINDFKKAYEICKSGEGLKVLIKP